MNAQIDDDTFEKTIRLSWPLPEAQKSQMFCATCDQCAGQCDAGKPCPRGPIVTDFGDLDDDRRSTESVGRMLLLALGAVSLIAAVVLAAA